MKTDSAAIAAFKAWASGQSIPNEERDGNLLIQLASGRTTFDVGVFFFGGLCELIVPYFDGIDGSVGSKRAQHHLGVLAQLNFAHGLARFGVGPDGKEVRLTVSSAYLSAPEDDFFDAMVLTTRTAMSAYEEVVWPDQFGPKAAPGK